MNETEFSSHC